MANLQFRHATSCDAESVSGLHRQEWHDAFSDEYVYPQNGEQRWRDELAASRLTAILAEVNGIPIAYLVYRKTEHEIEITDVFVIESHRRQGIAIRLLESLFERSIGVHAFSLWVAESNAVARSIYENMGFVETGERKTELRRRDSSVMIRLVSSS